MVLERRGGMIREEETGLGRPGWRQVWETGELVDIA